MADRNDEELPPFGQRAPGRLPPGCAEAIRSAEQSLTLLDQAFQTARRFDVENLDRMLADPDELRRSLSERNRTCGERP